MTSKALDYLDKLPKAVPRGKVLVHNFVTPPASRLGTRGFRAWLALPARAGSKLKVCRCGWAPELGRHYRVAGVKPVRKSG